MNVDWGDSCVSWGRMQPVEDGPIDFGLTDAWVEQMQSRGLNLLWALRLAEAQWAWGNDPDCFADEVGAGPGQCRFLQMVGPDCAPDSLEHEQDWYDYVYAIVERYDRDGVDDMPGLAAPLRFYLLPGEARMAPDCNGHADGYWRSSLQGMLQVSRIAHEALHDADQDGNASLVCPGGIDHGLFEDFPDYPAYDGPTVSSRIAADHVGRSWTNSWGELLAMYQSFGDDTDGVECDFVAWHPHFGWRGVDQAFRLMATEMTRRPGSHALPTYVDDMWVNLFPLASDSQYPFTPQDVTTTGDFPNATIDSLAALLEGLQGDDPVIVDWYYARQSRQIPKNLAAVFGLGADRASLSWMADDLATRTWLWPVGWQGVLDTASTGFEEKPGFHTYRLLIETLHDFSEARDLEVSSDPRTRCFWFARPARSDVIICWSETGPPPEDYSVPNGESVEIAVCQATARITHPIAIRDQSTPEREVVTATDGVLELRLGHEPIIVDEVTLGPCGLAPDAGATSPDAAAPSPDAAAADGGTINPGRSPEGCGCGASGRTNPRPLGPVLLLVTLVVAARTRPHARSIGG